MVRSRRLPRWLAMPLKRRPDPPLATDGSRGPSTAPWARTTIVVRPRRLSLPSSSNQDGAKQSHGLHDVSEVEEMRRAACGCGMLDIFRSLVLNVGKAGPCLERGSILCHVQHKKFIYMIVSVAHYKPSHGHDQSIPMRFLMFLFRRFAPDSIADWYRHYQSIGQRYRHRLWNRLRLRGLYYF